MDLCLDLGVWNSVFVVPSSIVDKHLRKANESQLKFILYLLRHPGMNFDEEIVCSDTGINGDAYKDALEYWLNAGLIKNVDDKLVPDKEEATKEVAFKESPKKEAPKKEIEPKKEEEKPEGKSYKSTIRKPSQLDPYYVQDRIKNDQELNDLVKTVESMFGGRITPSIRNIIVSCIDDYDMETPVVAMMFQYCASEGKKSVYYIDSLAKDWAENGITDYASAEIKLAELADSNQAWNKVSSICGMPERRSPSDKEKVFVNTWINEWHVSDDLIREAYNRSADNTGKMSLPYMNKVLKSWQDHRLYTIEDVRREDERRKEENRARAAQRESSYDLDKLKSSSEYKESSDSQEGNSNKPMTEEQRKALNEEIKAFLEKNKE